MSRTGTRSAPYAIILLFAAALCLHVTASVATAAQSWPSHQDPYWGIAVSYPPSWTLQGDPYRDFGVRLGSPDLVMDPLGRPLQGAVIAFAADDSAAYEPPPTFSGRYETSLGGLPAVRWETDDGAGAPVQVWQVLRPDALTMVTVSAASPEAAAAHASVVAQILDTLRFTGPYRAHPLPAPPAVTSAGAAAFPPIKHAFLPGPGWILSGYETWSHQNGDLYALDLCGGNKCRVGDTVLAATDLELVWSGRGFNMPADSKDFHILTFGHDEAGNYLCMSLGHLTITQPGIVVGGPVVPQGTVIGELVAMPTTPHIHTGLWRSPDHCARWTREPIPYTGAFALDGVDYPAGGDHRGKAITSTNAAVCPQGDCTAPAFSLTAPLTISPTQGISGDPLTVRFSLRNDGALPLTLPAIGVAGHAAACKPWQECTERADFPWQPGEPLAPGAVYTYEASRAFSTEEDGFLLRPLVQTDDETWHELGEPQPLAIAPALQISGELTLSSPQPRAGEAVTATFAVVNRSSRPHQIARLAALVRGPGCADWVCPQASDFPSVADLTLQAGDVFTYTATQTFAAAAEGYLALAAEGVVAVGDAVPWRPLGAGEPISFTVAPAGPTTLAAPGGAVSAGGAITVPLRLQHLSPGVRVGALHAGLTFDEDVLRAEACLVDSGDRYDLVQCSIDGDSIGLSAVSAPGVAGDHTLAQVIFRAKGDLGASSPLTVTIHTLADVAGAPIDVTAPAGRVDIHVPTPGDVTCDSTRAADDALFIVQHGMAQRPGAQSCPLPADTLLLPACDTNGDGVCNVIDGLLVLQCTVGMENALCGGETRPVKETPATVRVGFGAPRLESAGLTLPVTATVGSGALAAIAVAVPFDPAQVAAITCQPDPNSQFALAACHTDGTTVHVTLIAPAGVQGSHALATLTLVSHAGATAPLHLAAQIATLVDARGEAALVATDPLALALPSHVYLPALGK